MRKPQWQAWRLRTGRPHPPDEAARDWALIAAYSLAGHLGEHGVAPVRQLDVFEVGAVTGDSVHIGSWTPPEIEAEFGKLRTGRLSALAHDLTTSAGSHCAECLFVGACPAAPAVEGLLIGVPRQPMVRAVSASDLRTHADCAHRYGLLTVIGLPRDRDTENAAMLRGRQVDEWLTTNHSRGVRCTTADVTSLEATVNDAAVVAMAAHHLPVCPLAEPDTLDLRCQSMTTALDAESRVLLIARPDATYKRNGATVWRETKTRGTLNVRDAHTLVSTDLTAALYLTLLASGAVGAPDALEWEELGTDRHELTILPCDDHKLLDAARATISAAVADLLADDHFPARVGPGCINCAAQDWCRHRP